MNTYFLDTAYLLALELKTDCISFVLMKKYGIQTAFTFDRHFVQAGFNKEP
jgi:predicted nucleic acid-binding protein